jgi:hypothetical protein
MFRYARDEAAWVGMADWFDVLDVLIRCTGCISGSDMREGSGDGLESRRGCGSGPRARWQWFYDGLAMAAADQNPVFARRPVRQEMWEGREDGLVVLSTRYLCTMR